MNKSTKSVGWRANLEHSVCCMLLDVGGLTHPTQYQISNYELTADVDASSSFNGILQQPSELSVWGEHTHGTTQRNTTQYPGKRIQSLVRQRLQELVSNGIDNAHHRLSFETRLALRLGGCMCFVNFVSRLYNGLLKLGGLSGQAAKN